MWWICLCESSFTAIWTSGVDFKRSYNPQAGQIVYSLAMIILPMVIHFTFYQRFNSLTRSLRILLSLSRKTTIWRFYEHFLTFHARSFTQEENKFFPCAPAHPLKISLSHCDGPLYFTKVPLLILIGQLGNSLSVYQAAEQDLVVWVFFLADIP